MCRNRQVSLHVLSMYIDIAKIFIDMKHYKFDHENLTFVMIRHYTKPVIYFLLMIIFIMGIIILSIKVEKRMIYTEMKIVIAEQDKFTKEKLIDSIDELNFQWPYIVYAQAILESNHFQSKLFIENNNLFGMTQAVQRISTSKGTSNGYAYYSNWKESVYDYALYSATYLSKLTTEDQYYSYLAQYYASDVNYITKLKNIIEEQDLKSKFN